jgi:hypothetical protein
MALEDGDLALSSGTDLTVQAARSVVETLPLERAYRPRYGIPDPVFTATSNAAILAALYKTGVERQVREVTQADVAYTFDDSGGFNLSLYLKIKNHEPVEVLTFRS